MTVNALKSIGNWYGYMLAIQMEITFRKLEITQVNVKTGATLLVCQGVHYATIVVTKSPQLWWLFL